MTAAEILTRVAARRHHVVELALDLSLAARADVAIVRAVRLYLWPAEDISLETDLWCSPLVRTRAGDVLTLRADVASELWGRLTKDRDRLERAWSTLSRARPARSPPLLLLEEHLTYLALKDDGANAIDRELRTVIAAMCVDEGRRRDLAAWAARALARLPRRVRDCEAGRVLATAATAWVATPASLAALAPPSPEGARLAARLAPTREKRNLFVRRRGETLDVVTESHPAPWVTISVPSQPLAIVIDEDRVEPVATRGITRIVAGSSDEIRIGALDGKRWLLARPAPFPDTGAQTAFRGEFGYTVAYLVGPALAVTSGRCVWSAWSGPLTFGGETTRARVSRFDEHEDCAILELEPPITQVSPYMLETNVQSGARWQACFALESGEIPSGNVRAEGRRETLWGSGLVEETWPALELSIPGEDVGLLRPGTPIFGGSGVIGHLRRESSFGGNGQRLAGVADRIQPCPAQVVAARLQHVDAAEEAMGALVEVGRFDGAQLGAAQLGACVGAGLVVTMLPKVERPQVLVHDRIVEVKVTMTVATTFPMALLELKEPVASQVLRIERMPPPGSEVTILTYSGRRGARVVESTRDFDKVRFQDASEDRLKARPPAGAPCLYGGALVAITALDPDEAKRVGESPGDCFVLPVAFHMEPLLARYGIASSRAHGDRHALVYVPSRFDTTGLLAARTGQQQTTAVFQGHSTVGVIPWDITIVERGREPVNRAQSRPEAEEAYSFALTEDDDPNGDPAAGIDFSLAEEKRRQSSDLTVACGLASRHLRLRPTRRVAPILDMLFELRGGVLVMPRVLPGGSRGTALRRGLRFITEVLNELQLLRRVPPDVSFRFAVRIPGAGRFDLARLAAVLSNLGLGSIEIAEVDPETDVVELRSTPKFDLQDAELEGRLLVALGATFGPAVGPVYRSADDKDPLAFHCGIVPERRGRRLTWEMEEGALTLSVLGTDGRPLRGYVTFCIPSSEDDRSVQSVRVPASKGRASCALQRPLPLPRTVGAVVEDEAIELELLLMAQVNL